MLLSLANCASEESDSLDFPERADETTQCIPGTEFSFDYDFDLGAAPSERWNEADRNNIQETFWLGGEWEKDEDGEFLERLYLTTRPPNLHTKEMVLFRSNLQIANKFWSYCLDSFSPGHIKFTSIPLVNLHSLGIPVTVPARGSVKLSYVGQDE